jgi:LPXTG-motif cell wall-anchored protein
MEDAFTSFDAAAALAAPQTPGGLAPPTSHPSSSSHQLSHPSSSSHQLSLHPPRQAPLLARIPVVTWLILAGAVLVIVTAMLYYRRRKQTTQAKEADLVQTLSGAVKSLQHELDVLAQQQGVLTSQIRSVATHSRSVEQGLGQALESWTGTIQQLRNEFEMLVEEEEVAEEEDEAEQQPPPHHPPQPQAAPEAEDEAEAE